MSIIVNTNIFSLLAQRGLNRNTKGLEQSIERLSTGFRINRAGDDAAGLSISESLTAQIRGMYKAKQNAGDGVSMVQTAEGSLSVIHDNLQRIRELVVQSKNETNETTEKEAIQAEIEERVKTITGAIGGSGIKLDDLDVTGTANISDLDTLITNVSGMRSYLGAVQNSLESRMDYLDVAIENNSSSLARVRDVDVAKETSILLKNQILQKSAATMLSQANSPPKLALDLLP